MDLYAGFKEHWQLVLYRLIERIDPGRYDCYENGKFKERNFERLIIDRMGIIDWPRTECGSLKKDSRTLKDLARSYPELNDFRELYSTLQQLKEFDFGIGKDGRHRADMLSPFGADTARHTPSKFIFALATWFRGLIKPATGRAILYSDYSGQEIYIAAWQSKDPNLLDAVGSGDPYLWFLKNIGRVPTDASKATHGDIRNWIKPFILGVHYGLTAQGAALRLGISITEASSLLEHHKRLFSVYWQWAEDKVQAAFDAGQITSRWGWRMYVGYGTKPRSVQNHPIQNMGAHILQIAIMGLTERGIQVCAPVHDAVLTECSLSEVDRHIAQVEEVMRIASKVALGMEIPVDTKKIVYPNRYMDNRGQKMFNLATEILSDIRLHDESESDSLSYSYSTTVPTPWDVPPGSYPLGATPPTTLGTLGEVWLCPRIISEIIISDI